MNKNKKGFSLSEVMIAMAILSIVIISVLQISKPFQPKYKTLYYYAYSMVIKFSNEMTGKSIDKKITPDDSKFCQDLTNTVNTKGSTNCTLGAATKDAPLSGMTVSRIDSPNFTLTNSMRVYLSGRNVDSLSNTGYRVIAIDLNGTGRPNTSGEDIVPFIMYDSGEVFPTGDAAAKEEYMATQVGIYTDKSSADEYLTNENSLSKTKRTLSYQEGYCRAGMSSVVYPNYCSAISKESVCSEAGKNCIMSIIKPVLKVKI